MALHVVRLGKALDLGTVRVLHSGRAGTTAWDEEHSKQAEGEQSDIAEEEQQLVHAE